VQNYGQLSSMAFKQEQLWFNANERIPWHNKLDGEEALQKRVHEYELDESLFIAKTYHCNCF
jgi:hypothetical protein